MNKGQKPGGGEDMELLPLYVNPESSIVRVSEDAVSQIRSLKKITNTLKRFDLSKNEVRVYLYLARFGPQKALTIAKSLDIHRTETYKILNNLESQALLSRILERPLRFKATPLEKALNNFIKDRRRRITQLEKKKEELLDIWSNLPQDALMDEAAEKQTYQVLETKRQISLKLSDLINECKNNMKIALKSKEISWLYTTLFFEDLMEKAQRDNISVRLITNYSSLREEIHEDLAIGEAQIGLVKEWDIPSFFLRDNKELILILEDRKEELSGMWTNYRSMTKSYNILFNLLWKNKTSKIKR
ncbi:MAG: TrmB family transcriptional regulator [Candidatus Bathyarchaeia archaeon]